MPRRTQPYLPHASFRPGVDRYFAEYPCAILAVRELENIAFHPNVNFFVGENGSGKSTVLEAIAMALGFGLEGGRTSAFVPSRRACSHGESLMAMLLNQRRYEQCARQSFPRRGMACFFRFFEIGRIAIYLQ